MSFPNSPSNFLIKHYHDCLKCERCKRTPRWINQTPIRKKSVFTLRAICMLHNIWYNTRTLNISGQTYNSCQRQHKFIKQGGIAEVHEFCIEETSLSVGDQQVLNNDSHGTLLCFCSRNRWYLASWSSWNRILLRVHLGVFLLEVCQLTCFLRKCF